MAYSTKEKSQSYLKEYYIKKKDEIVECKCGLIIKKLAYKSHLKSKKHELILLLLNK